MDIYTIYKYIDTIYYSLYKLQLLTHISNSFLFLLHEYPNCIPFIIPNDWNNYTKHGDANGYVAIPKIHPLYGKQYTESIPYNPETKFNGNIIGLTLNSFNEDTTVASIDTIINVHGGITYSANFNTRMLANAEFLTEDEAIDEYWIFGFDTCHYDDTATNWPKERVIEETLNFCKQLEEFEMYIPN